MEDAERYWDEVYATKAIDQVSWFQAAAETSLRLTKLVSGPAASVIDIGAGASVFAGSLLADGYCDITALDVSNEALATLTTGLPPGASVTLLTADVTTWVPSRHYDVWHDRAVFHFMTTPGQRAAYLAALHAAVPVGGHIIIGTFADDGPEMCSGLPTARYSAAQLAVALGGNFATLHVEQELHHTPWSSDQSFTWIVAQRTS